MPVRTGEARAPPAMSREAALGPGPAIPRRARPVVDRDLAQWAGIGLRDARLGLPGAARDASLTAWPSRLRTCGERPPRCRRHCCWACSSRCCSAGLPGSYRRPRTAGSSRSTGCSGRSRWPGRAVATWNIAGGQSWSHRSPRWTPRPKRRSRRRRRRDPVPRPLGRLLADYHASPGQAGSTLTAPRGKPVPSGCAHARPPARHRPGTQCPPCLVAQATGQKRRPLPCGPFPRPGHPRRAGSSSTAGRTDRAAARHAPRRTGPPAGTSPRPQPQPPAPTTHPHPPSTRTRRR